MKRGKEHGCSFVVMSAYSPMVRQEDNATRLGRGLGVALAGVVILAVVGVNSAGAQSAARQRGCGNGVCSGAETCSTCPADCGACPPVCGDGTCNGTETCSTCPGDCGVCGPVCGDGVCNGTESCATCVADCGTCQGCTTDSDCVPATCCHAAACVPADQAPLCGGACDGGCNPFTLDCAQGYCACQNGQCTAVLFVELQNSDGPVATKLSSDPARTSPELAAPTNLSALGSQGQIDISWEDNSHGETGFEVHRSPTGAPNSFILLETVGINGTAFSNSGLTLDEHFCYQVRAVREGTSTTSYSEFSNIACTTAAPVAIVSFEAVFAGGAHTSALTSVGAAYCWGRGESGQLGVPPAPSTCLTDGGPFSCSMVPVQVGGWTHLREACRGAVRTPAA
jgi:hypothetical protein